MSRISPARAAEIAAIPEHKIDTSDIPEASAAFFASAKLTARPVVREHDGVLVIRDDLFPGGTKARYLGRVFDGVDEVIYASPAEGGAQTALAELARAMGKRVTIFVAKRAKPHPRSLMVKRLGGTVVQVAPGYLSVVQARAKAYFESRSRSALVPFGGDMPGAIEAIAEAARAAAIPDPDEVWCAAGSGVLARGLARAWPKAKRFAVQIGRAISREEAGGADIIIHRLAFGNECKTRPPFPSDPHYDAKAWEICQARKGTGRVVFWNVTGPANEKGGP